MKKSANLRSVFGIPTLIALVSLFGLIIALTGDGWRNVAGWIALGFPVAVVVYFRLRNIR